MVVIDRSSMATLTTDDLQRMEDPVFERTYHPHYLPFSRFLRLTHSPPLSPYGPPLTSLTSLVTFPGMGRRSWATPEQLEFLKSYIPRLPHAKKTSGLRILYTEIYDDFLKKWAPEPIAPKPGVTSSPEVLEIKAKERLLERITNWYKEERKKQILTTPPSSELAPRVLNLSGKSKRRKPPYQLHQAFSILYWQPKDSPLRREVNELWAKRNEPSVHEKLKPFLKETAKTSNSSSERLMFHMAVMRWKCSLMTAEELAIVRQWVEGQHAAKKAARALPWLQEATEHGDGQFAENTYIQNSIDDLALTVQVAIEEIERQTGWKVMVILGGLEPRVGSISSHLYTTGKSLTTGQAFHEAHPEVGHVRKIFHEWLRTVYSDEDKKKRCLQGAVSFLSMSTPHLADTEGPTTPATDAADDASPITAEPTDDTSPSAMDMDDVSPSTAEPTDDTSPSDSNVSSMGGPHDLNSLTLPLPGTRTPDHPSIDTGSRDSPQDSPETPVPDDPSPNPPSTPSPVCLPHNVLVPPCTKASTPGIPSTQPPLASAGKGAFDLTGVLGDFISEDTCTYWESLPGGEKWVAMVKSYLVLQTTPPLKGQLQRLLTASRPQVLQDWLRNNKRSLSKVPLIIDPRNYGCEWVKWWTAAQPKERNAQGWPLTQNDNSGIDWRRFPANGKDGLFVAVMALSWWAPAVQSPSEVEFFEEAVTDLHWVIQQLTRVKTTPQLPPSHLSPQGESNLPAPSPSPPAPSSSPPAPSPSPPAQPSRPPASSSRPPVSFSNVHTHQRADGKRVVKPTWKVKDF